MEKLAGGTPSSTAMACSNSSRFCWKLASCAWALAKVAFDPKLRREVALKIPRPEMLMSPDARRRLFREALAAAEFDHPNLVPVYETGEIGPVCYIATRVLPRRHARRVARPAGVPGAGPAGGPARRRRSPRPSSTPTTAACCTAT